MSASGSLCLVTAKSWEEEMLLKLGTGMTIFAVTFTVVVAIVVNLSGAEEPATSETAVDLQAAETPAGQEEKFDFGDKLEIDDEPREEPQAAEPPVQENAPEISEKAELKEEPPPKPREEPPPQPREEPPASPP